MTDPATEERIRKFLEKDSPEPEEVKENKFSEKNYVARSIANKLEASLKPKGTFNIPELLDDRRIEYGIPNGAFDTFPAFDKIFVHQIPFTERSEFSEGGIIVMTEVSQAYERNMAPRGILIAAGLKALDALSSNGIEVGHIIRFRKMHPYIMPVECIDGHWMTMYVMRDGDITGSEDVAQKLRSKEYSLVNVADDKGTYDWRLDTPEGVTGSKLDSFDDME